MNKVEWQDIVKVNGEYYLERFEVEFEDEELNSYQFPNNENGIIEDLYRLEKLNKEYYDPLYNCDKFFEAVRKKYNLAEDNYIETYMFDEIDLPEEVEQEFDIAWLGGYINGVNI